MKLEEEIKQKQFSDEYHKLVINIMYTNSWLTNIQSRFFKQYGLSGPQYNVLRILRGQYPKPATVSLIMERMIDKMSNASRIVDKLEKKALVERKTCPSDRRAVDVVITGKGLGILKELDDSEVEWKDALKRVTNQEAKILNDLLDKLRG